MTNIEDKSKESEEIIFPETPVPSPARGLPALMKAVLGIAALFFTFWLGFMTNPESLDKTIKKIKTINAVVMEKAQPFEQQTKNIMESKLMRKDDSPPIAPAKQEKKIKYWGDPMVPDFRSDKPGKSPMNMDLIPFYEEEDDAAGIKINPTTTQNIGVKTETVREQTLKREIRTIGRVTYDERKVINIHTRYDGWLETLYVNFTGEEVKEGDLLADIYSPQLVSTQEEMLLAIKYQQTVKDSPFPDIRKAADSLLESTRRRLELFDIPEHQIEDLIHNKTITKTMHLHSHAKGFVLKKDILPGMYVKPDMTLFTIVDLSTIWVLADVYEYELPWIHLGQKAEVNLSYLPGKLYKGKITYIDPFLDPKTRTVKVRVELNNPKWELKPEMYANVRLRSIVGQKTVTVAEEAVIHSGERNLVVIRMPDGRFQSHEVKLGLQANGYYQALSGLKVGDQVVTSSNFLIDSESRLQEAINKLESKKIMVPTEQSRKKEPVKTEQQAGSHQSLPEMKPKN